MHARFHGRARPALDIDVSREIEVELGCADARFLFERAPRFPQRLFIGLEIRQPMVQQVNDEARALGLPNLLAHFSHINVDLQTLFPDRSLARVFVNFPDPWFKRRHRRRRLMNEDLVDVLHRKLRPDGELFFQSDVFDLALDALAVLELEPDKFANAHGEWSFARANPYQAKSLREVRCEERGMRIWRLCYRRIGA
jgi:tRNA (guanine-N7-)-methyltransferase